MITLTCDAESCGCVSALTHRFPRISDLGIDTTVEIVPVPLDHITHFVRHRLGSTVGHDHVS